MNKNRLIPEKEIEERIFTFRDQKIMIDRDLAEMYQVKTKVLNQAVKRNIERFPEIFRFQLNDDEKNELVTNCDRFKSLKHSIVNPYAFTEQGVAMLSAVLRSGIAIQVSIEIMNAFVQMRKLIDQDTLQQLRISKIEDKIITYDQNFERIFKALEDKNAIPAQGVFFDGQIFDAYELTTRIIRSAKKSIILIDNYIDESTFTHLAKKNKEVEAIVLTRTISKKLLLDIKKANQQYGNFTLKVFNKSHDRFLIIDNNEIYHLGASLKDLGKKWFVYTKMNKDSVESILNKIEQ